jgi:hypothetical protein
MTPDQHAELAEQMLLVAEGWYRERIDDATEAEQDPKDHMFVQTLSGLAQVHAILSLHRSTPPALTAGTHSGVYEDLLARLRDRTEAAAPPTGQPT